jgi:hypothetical protein
MTRRPDSGGYEERRNARIRQLREQREGPVRRRKRVQPLLLLMWIAGTIGLLIIALIFGFNAFFAPRVMAWVEANPESRKPLYQVPHSKGVIGLAANFVYHIKSRMEVAQVN